MMTDNKEKIRTQVAMIILTFFVGAIIGWCWETLWIYVSKGVLANRGVLHGPWLPIYGTGCIVMMVLKQKIRNRPGCFFLASMLVCGMVEYITSWALEVVYHTRWWDYSDTFLNINGRVCFVCLLFFGVAGSIIVYVLLPKLKSIAECFSEKTIQITAFILMIVFILDALFSIITPNMGLGITI